MATVTGFNYTHDGTLTKAYSYRPAFTTSAGSITTYCYRTALGVRGTTTDEGSIPVGAEIERVVVS